jgi:CelD/BcsL family acetyltransferase involved in cellulose biosynthesis
MLNISLRKIDGSSEFYCLNKLWNKLLQQSAVDTIFLTWEWMYTWWECFNDGKRLFIVTAKVDDEIVGIAPLHVTRSLLFGILSRRSLEFLGSDGVITEYSDFIIKKGKEDIILPLFLDFIFQNTSEWDLLNLTSINQNSVNLKKIKSYCVNKGLKLLDYNFNVSPFIELPATIDQYLKTLSNKSRWKFKNYRKKLQNARKVDLILTDDKRNLKKNLQLIM